MKDLQVSGELRQVHGRCTRQPVKMARGSTETNPINKPASTVGQTVVSYTVQIGIWHLYAEQIQSGQRQASGNAQCSPACGTVQEEH